jgi:hypothetical protein
MAVRPSVVQCLLLAKLMCAAMTRCGVYLSVVGMLPFWGLRMGRVRSGPQCFTVSHTFVVRAVAWACAREYVVGRNVSESCCLPRDVVRCVVVLRVKFAVYLWPDRADSVLVLVASVY